MPKKPLLLALIMGLVIHLATAQSTGSVSGVVKDKTLNEGLFGATAVLKGTNYGTMTGMEGGFKIENVPSGTYTLKISYIGFSTIEQPVTVSSGDVNVGEVVLEEEAIGLDEVQVFASVVEERKSPVAISTINAQQIDERFSNVSLAEAIQNVPGVYTIQGAGGYGDQEVYIRGFDQSNVAFLVNGIPVNDMENGRMFWSNFAGLSQVTRTTQVQRGLGASKLAVSSIGGTVNMITKPSDRSEGGRIEYQTGTGSWNNRLRFTYNTGESANGWAFSLQGTRTTTSAPLGGLSSSEQGSIVPGAYTDAWSYYISASKKINDNHQLMFWAFGAPVNRGTAFVVDDQTREIFNIDEPMANNALGIYRGELFNARQNKVNKPLTALTHYWDFDANTNLTTSVYYSRAKVYSVQPQDAEASVFFQDRSNPNLIGNEITPDNLIDWDYLSEQNRDASREVTVPYPNGDPNTPSVTGYASQYYLESRHNNHDWIGVVSNFTKQLNRLRLRAGVDLRFYKGEHYAQVYDVMGGDFIIQENRFGDAFNKLDTENAIGREGDKTNYHYDGIVNWYSAFSQAEYTVNKLDLFASATLTFSDMQRVGYFWNGSEFNDFDLNSLGESEKRTFTTYTFKTGANYRITGRHNVYANAGYFTRPPFLQTAFNDSRYSNEYRNGLTEEKVTSGEVGYGFKTSFLKVNFNAYYLLWTDRTTQFNQQNQGEEGTPNFLPVVLNGLVSEHKGLEFDFTYNVISSLELNGFLSLGDWVWKDVPAQELFLDDGSSVLVDDLSVMEGLPVGTSAQTTAGLGFHYRGIRSAYIGGRLQYADRIPIRYSPEDIAEGFLIKMSTADDIVDPTDLSEESDGATTVNVASGVGSYSWTGLDAGTQYFFKIYPFTNPGLAIDYKTDGTIPSDNATTDALPDLILVDEFDYGTSAGDLTAVSGGNWNNHSGSGAIGYATTSLDLFGYTPSAVGGSATFGGGGEDVNQVFNTLSSGTVYLSALINVSSAPASPDYFFHMRQASGSFNGRVYAQDDAGTLRFGVAKGSSSTMSTDDFEFGKTYLVVLKYTFNAGSGTDDVAELFVMDAYSATETTPVATSNDGSSDASDLNQVAFRQGNVGGSADRVRVALTWAEAVGTFVNCTPTVQASSIGFGSTGDNTTTVGWTRGDGDEVIVIAKSGAAVDAEPENGVSYTADAAFGSGTELGTGNFVVYTGTGTSVAVTGLTVATTYHFAVYEYNTTDNCYLLTAPLTGSETTTGTDTQAPTVQSASTSADGVSNQVNLTLSENVTVTDATGFTININGNPATISDFGASDNSLDFLLEDFIFAGDVVTMDYDDTQGDVADLAANPLASFTDQAVTNNATTVMVEDIASLRAGATDGTVYRLATEAVLLYQQSSRNQKYIQDSNGDGILIDDSPGNLSTTYAIGDGISNIEGTLSVFNNILQLIPTGDAGAATSTENGFVSTTVAIDEFNANYADYQSQYLRFEAVTFAIAGGTFDTGADDYTVTDGANNLTYRDNLSSARIEGGTIPYGRLDVYGVAGEFSSAGQVYPISTTISDVAVDNYEPLFTVAPAMGNETIDGGDITFQSDEPGSLFYLVVADEASAPDAATVLAGTEVAYTEVGATATVTISGLSDNTAYDVYVLLSDGTNSGDTPVKLDITTVEIVFDADSDIQPADSPIGASTLSGLEDTMEEAIDVFAFKIVDSGTADSESTMVTSAVIVPGPNNTASWSTTLGGAILDDGTNTYSGTISDLNITFDMSSTPSSVPSSGALTYTLSIWTSGSVNDQGVLQFGIPINHEFSSDPSGSILVEVNNPPELSNDHTIDVVATAFDVDVDATVPVAENFSLSVSAVDANGNVDAAARTISLSGTGAGNLTGTGLTTQAMTDGTYEWTDLQLDTEGSYTLTVDDDGSALTESVLVEAAEITGGVFFSEYIETSSSKVLEIYNGTGIEIDLSEYTIRQSNNGSGFGTAPSQPQAYDLVLSGTLAAGDVFVISNGTSDPTISGVADLEVPFGNGTDAGTRTISFNGDDALGLFHNGDLIDLFGDPASDPGSSWPVAGSGLTEDVTLVRKGTILEGNTVALGSFGTDSEDSEWTVYSQGDFSYIGYHLLEGETIPLITLDQSAFEGNFGIIAFGNSSTPSMYSITGVDLAADLTITPPVGFEVSATMAFDGTVYSNSSPWTITPTDGAINQDVYVRFTPEASDGASYSGDISHESIGADSKTISVSGVEGVFDTAPNLSGIVFNEILTDANSSGEFNYDTDGNGTANNEDEFIELYNMSESAVDISGWEIWEEGGLYFTFPASTIVQPGAYVGVITAVQDGGALPTPSGNNLVFDALGSSFGNFSNGGENIALHNPNANEYIQMKYNGDADADFSSDLPSASLVSIIEDWGNDTDGLSLVREPAGDLNIVLHNSIQGAGFASFGAPTIDPNAPSISIVSDAFDAAFGNILISSESAVRTYTVSGSNLEADISITASADYLISSNGTDFSGSLTLTQSGGSVSETTISVKFSPGAFGSSDGAILHTSTNAPSLDIDVSGAGIDENTIYFNGFGSCDDLSGFTAQSVAGTEAWTCTSNGETGDGIAMSGFNFGSFSGVANEDWIVSPAIDLSSVDGADLSFDTDVAFDGTGTLTVQVSSDYSGDVTTATWTELDATLDLYDSETENDGVFISSGDVRLTAGGTVHIAFKYVSEDDANGAVEYRIDNFLIYETQPFFSVDDDGFQNDFQTQDVGTTSPSTSFIVEGFGLTENVEVTPPAQFEVSTTSNFASKGTSSSPLTITVTDGSIDQQVFVRFAPAAEGTFNGNVVVSTSGFDNITLSVSGVGVDDEEPALGLNDANVVIYPNPIADVFEISNTKNAELSVEIFALDGAKMQVSKKGNLYDISSLNSGVYVIVVRDGENELRQQIIKE
ncbi:MAG: lamin tail domain-containing protein [Ekhidna sp.]|uniref:lamin tail domain-containing protein n=1 Tax=Ekhidna sp. TaxID=2608089 RepID=UPI0032EFD8AD